MKFPLRIKHRKQEATIYGKSAAYDFYRVNLYVAGRRIQKSFAAYGDAIDWANEKVRELAQGSQTLALSADETTDALAIRAVLAEYHRATGRRLTSLEAVKACVEASRLLPDSHSLTTAVRSYVQTNLLVQQKPVEDAIEEFCATRRSKAVSRDGTRPALNAVYVHDTEQRLKSFAAAMKGHFVSDLTRQHLNTYLASFDHLSPKSRNHIRAALKLWLKWCVRNDLLPRDNRLSEADGVQKEPLTSAPIDFYRPDELRALLTHAQGHMRAVIALQAFAGLRLVECLRADWREIFGAQGHVEVTSAKSKTRQRRLVERSAILDAWLAEFRTETGQVSTQSLCAHNNAFADLRKKAGVISRKNGLRHAYATYSFALTTNENAVAAALGNSPGMIHAHYRGLATKADAEKWFSVAPAQEAANVIPLSQATA